MALSPIPLYRHAWEASSHGTSSAGGWPRCPATPTGSPSTRPAAEVSGAWVDAPAGGEALPGLEAFDCFAARQRIRRAGHGLDGQTAPAIGRGQGVPGE